MESQTNMLILKFISVRKQKMIVRKILEQKNLIGYQNI